MEHPGGVRIPVLRRSGAFDRHLGLGGSVLRQAGVWVCRLWGERGLDGLGQAVQVLAWRQRDASAEPMVSTEQPLRRGSPVWAC